MTSSAKSVNNQALVSYIPPGTDKEHMAKIYGERSLSFQIVESRLFHPVPIRTRFLAGDLTFPEIGTGLPEPFKGNRQALIEMIEETINETANSTDFNTLWPFLEMLRQMDNKRTFREMKIDSSNQEGVGTCFGKTFALLKNLKVKHNVEGSLAGLRTPSKPDLFHHAVVVIECLNGYVLLDLSQNDLPSFVSISFESTLEFEYERACFYIISSKPGSLIPLTIKRTKSPPEYTAQYCTNVVNAEDLAAKKFVMRANMLPITFWNRKVDFVNQDRSVGFACPNKALLKSILVCLDTSKIIFKDKTVTEKSESEEFSFTAVLEKGFLPRLKAFMEPNYCCIVPGFRTTAKTIHQQIIALINQKERIKQLWEKTDLDESFT